MGFSPLLFTVPGNHDLVRPSGTDAETIILNDWWNNSSIHEHFWSYSGNNYKKAIESAFYNYTKWTKKLSSIGIPTATIKNGLLPGDSSAIINVGKYKIGLIGFNSAWLQLGEKDYLNHLHIDVKQLLEVTDGDATTWCSGNNINLLITHHPVDWLHSQSLQYFNSDINTPGRFDAHLYGHMHKPDVTSISQGGAQSKISIQAASLFGLKQVSSVNLERIHGYNVGKIIIDNNSVSLKIWPRRDQLLTVGSRKLCPDQTFDLTEDNCFSHIYEKNTNGLLSPPPQSFHANQTPFQLLFGYSSSTKNVLNRVRYHLSSAKEHLNVRRVEQENCLAGIREERAVWVISEWGMGSDGFIWALNNRLNTKDIIAYRLDLQNYTTREIFLDTIQEQLNCSFQQLCELLSNEECSYLLLDDIPVGEFTFTTQTENDLENMVTAILQYCPNIRVFLRSRRPPQKSNFQNIEIKQLDEADTKTYVLAHKDGGEAMGEAETISQLYRFTDGFPSRIDEALKYLKVISLPELLSNNSDISGNDLNIDTVPNALMRTISALSNSTDSNLKRAYELLKILTIFPRGEQFSRIKRFNGPNGFYPTDIHEIYDRALINSQVVMEIGSNRSMNDVEKTLVVSRPVREYVYTLLTENEFKTLNRRAASLYFGENWASGKPKSPSEFRFNDPHRSSVEIENANIIIQRLIQEAVSPLNFKSIREAIQLASFYCNALSKGSHYRQVVIFCNDFLSLIHEEGLSKDLTIIRYRYAHCLRMTGKHALAKAIFMDLKVMDDANLRKPIRHLILIGLALCHKSLDETNEAIEVANELKKMDENSNASLQADAIILELSTEDTESLTKLQKLKTTAIKKKATYVVNNISMYLAHREQDPIKKRELLNSTLTLAFQNAEYHNLARAALGLGELSMKKEGSNLTKNETFHLIQAYNYNLNQRDYNSFKRCHAVLWNMFDRDHDISNLLRLFRQGSFVWQLWGKDGEERIYLQKLSDCLGSKAPSIDFRYADKEMAYFLARNSVALNNSSNGASKNI